MSTSELKTRCAKVIDDVVRKRRPVIVTKRGRPVARIVPIEQPSSTVFGFAKGTIRVLGDIVEPVEVEWESQG